MVVVAMGFFALTPTYPVAFALVALIGLFALVQYREAVSTNTMHQALIKATQQMDELTGEHEAAVQKFVDGVNLEYQKINQVTAALSMGAPMKQLASNSFRK